MLFWKHVADQPVAVDCVTLLEPCVPEVPVSPPGKLRQLVDVCTDAKTWTPTPNRIAAAMKVVMSAMTKLDDSINGKLVF